MICSSHLPIQVNLYCNKSLLVRVKHEISIDKIIWNSNKSYEYKSMIENEIINLELVVNDIVSGEIDINTGDDNFSSI